jgi:hypothetical protein
MRNAGLPQPIGVSHQAWQVFLRTHRRKRTRHPNQYGASPAQRFTRPDRPQLAIDHFAQPHHRQPRTDQLCMCVRHRELRKIRRGLTYEGWNPVKKKGRIVKTRPSFRSRRL